MLVFGSSLANVLRPGDQFAERHALSHVVRIVVHGSRRRRRGRRERLGHDEHQQIGKAVANGVRVLGVQQPMAEQLQRPVHGGGGRGGLP